MKVLVDEALPAGTFEVSWNGNTLPSGMYFYRMQTGVFTQTKKMLLLK